MAEALDAVRGLFSRFDTGEGLCSLRSVGVIVLALERSFVDAELKAILRKLARRDDGSLDLISSELLAHKKTSKRRAP